MLDKNQCNSCHFKGSFQTSWHYDTYQAIFSKDKCGTEIIDRKDVSGSSLIDKINGGSTSCGHSMPLNNNKVSREDLLAIESWIQYGAPEFCISTYEQVKIILDENKCNTCHYQNSPTPWSYETFEMMLLNGTNSVCNENIIEKYNAVQSLLYKKIAPSAENLCGSPMRVEGKVIDELALAKIRDWINAGAVTSAFILPVSLSSFDAKLNSAGHPVLSWRTQAEYNTSYFEVQFSMDGKAFKTIGSLDAKNQNGADYFFEHTDFAEGFHYYRLRIVDIDNSANYSQIRVVRIENNEELLDVYPTVLSASKYASLTVSWYPSSSREATYISVMDISGKQSIKEKILIGVNYIDVSFLKPGLYYLTVRDFSGLTSIRRIVITH